MPQNQSALKPTLRRPYDQSEGYYVTHPNGQVSHYYLDSFVDPWLPWEEKLVIMLNHGCARTAAMWYSWVPRLARRFVVIRRDARGGYRWDLDTMLYEIVDMLDQLNIKKVIFLGEATSGEVGHAFAAKYPERTIALVTCSTPTLLPPAAVDMFAVGESSWPEAVMKHGVRGWNERLAKTPGTLPKDSAYLEWLLDEAAKTEKEGLAGYVIFLTYLTSRPFLKDIKKPYLILAPTNSVAVPLSESRWISEQVPGSKMVEIEAPGHEIFSEATGKCIDAVLEFLDEIHV
ncbi:Alpha/Beta hydrolase protein [Dactylonectria macrodidyma]|uniref:Alpha/Beta hydrolase protein n=1 Tax=Dactylonectria macrodidyma TaxID=307937 RepID=A0A9P9JC24_9HYPO|nr:Alpha/Beta hydrolase protein [Dactylonectria macrodidyma]